jgi:hypothetical protein
MFTEAKKPFLDAIAPFVRDALEGRLGSPGPMARVQLLLVAGRACGREITPRVEACLADDDRQMRETAAAVIVNVPGPNSVAALKNAWWRRQDAVTRGALHRALERVVLSQPVK